MKPFTLRWLTVGVVCSVGLAGCGKKTEPVTSAPAAPTTVPGQLSPPAQAAAAPDANPMAPALVAVQRASQAVVTSLKVPDFQTASVDDLSEVASQALTSLNQVAGSAPAVAEKVRAVKAALETGTATQALSSLAGLSAAAKSVPGAANIAGTATQVVSAWALKQGFDVAKISGVLGALQKKDYAALAAQATSVLSQGGLTGDQKSLLSGVLAAYGIDVTKAAGAAGALKGLFAK